MRYLIDLFLVFWPELGGKPLAALRATGRQHFLSAFGRLARTEAVATLALQPAWLIGPFHRSVLKAKVITARSANSQVKQEAGA